MRCALFSTILLQAGFEDYGYTYLVVAFRFKISNLFDRSDFLFPPGLQDMTGRPYVQQGLLTSGLDFRNRKRDCHELSL